MRIQEIVPFVLVLAFAWSLAAPSDVLASSHETRSLPADRCLKVDAATRALALIPRGSPDCLQLKPTGELARIGASSSCVAIDRNTRSLFMVDGVSPDCVRLDSAVEVVRGGATACFGIDPGAGVITLRPPGSPPVDPRTGTLSPVGAVPAPPLCIDPGLGLLSLLGTPIRVEKTSAN